MIKLENDIIEAKIKPLGAELVSLFKKENQTEMMWSADPAFWAKTSPVLFPIVGGLKGNAYHYEGKSYSLGRHGFAREKVFEVEEQTGERVVFLLKSDETSLEVYPFEFELRLIYELNGHKLTVTYQVSNPSGSVLWFSVGGHPAFKVPVAAGTTYQDYYLAFEKPEEFLKWPLNAEGLTLESAVSFHESSDKLPLTKSLFYEDALVFKGLKSESISIQSDKTDARLKFSFKGFPYFGIWAAKDADFVCLEPWCGIADAASHNQELTQKEGINHLTAGQTFRQSWEVEI